MSIHEKCDLCGNVWCIQYSCCDIKELPKVTTEVDLLRENAELRAGYARTREALGIALGKIKACGDGGETV